MPARCTTIKFKKKLYLAQSWKFQAFLDVTPCRRVNNFRRFERSQGLYLQGQAVQNSEGTTILRNAGNCLGLETSTQTPFSVGSWFGRRGAKRTKCLNLRYTIFSDWGPVMRWGCNFTNYYRGGPITKEGSPVNLHHWLFQKLVPIDQAVRMFCTGVLISP